MGEKADIIQKSIEKINKSKEKINTDKNVEILEKSPSIETLPNPNFYWGNESFQLENGDEYIGEYCCHKSGIIWREGQGTYTTKDEHTYTGAWENDQLLNSPESHVIYPDKDEYFGNIQNGQYSGKGVYVFNNKLVIESEFLENKPVGEVTLIDYEGHLWRGMAEANRARLLCVNHFFETIPPERGLGRLIPVKSENKSHAPPDNSKSAKSTNLQELIFAKYTKTKNDFDMENIEVAPSISKTKYGIKSKASRLIFKATEEDEKSTVSITLLKTFLSKKYRTRNYPIPVFIPTCDQDKLEQVNEDKEEAAEKGTQ